MSRIWTLRTLPDRRRVLIALGTVGAVMVVVLVVVVMPQWFAPRRAFASAGEAVRAQNDVRTTLLQGLGGAVLLLGAYLTWQQLRHTIQTGQQQYQVSLRQHELDRQGQITERFTRAIDQLGNTNGRLDVILGGIYALERVARDSPDDQEMIGEILAAYVRGHAPWPPSRPGQPPADAPPAELPSLQAWAPDVQAAMTVLGRGSFTDAARRLDLGQTDLRKADLAGMHLPQANLASAHLEEAKLAGTHLEGVDLAQAHLQRATLTGAQLQEANLAEAHLERANGHEAHLEKANLAGADLRDAAFIAAHFERARLGGAHLEGAYLNHAHLEGATLVAAHLEGAYLVGIHLEGSYLDRARLEQAALADAHLEQAYLDQAHLEEASLAKAYLQDASLAGAHLEGANLAGAHLEGARANRQTVWPEGFDAKAAGVKIGGS